MTKKKDVKIGFDLPSFKSTVSSSIMPTPPSPWMVLPFVVAAVTGVAEKKKNGGGKKSKMKK